MIYENLFILAQAATPTPAAGGGGSFGALGPFIPMICIGVIFYFLLIRPQGQKQKQQQAMISSVKTGDKIITAGGMHGLVANVKDTTVLVKVADNVKIEVDKSAIAVVTKRSEDDPAPAS
jgi:preprotein translocase subunit YajC